MYTLEMHCHTSGPSACSHTGPEELISEYRKAGYNGVVSTNHICLYSFEGMESAPWREKARYFYSCIEALQKSAGPDFDVFPGCEVNLSKTKQDPVPNDYLIYGITEDWLISAGDVRKMTISRLSACVRETGTMLIVQAHPFRKNTVIVDPGLLDGMESYNGSRKYDSDSRTAKIWAAKNGLIMTSGSDFHNVGDRISGGILVRDPVRDMSQLIGILRSGDYMPMSGKQNSQSWTEI